MPDARLPGRRTETLDGSAPFVWVEDAVTGYRYDVPQNAIVEGLTPVDGYPLNFTGAAREPKYTVDKTGESAPREVTTKSSKAVS